MFTFTIEDAAVVNGHFVKEEPPPPPVGGGSGGGGRCLLSREKSVASYQNAPL